MRLFLGSSNLLTYVFPREALAFSNYFAEQGILMRKEVQCHEGSNGRIFDLASHEQAKRADRLSFTYLFGGPEHGILS